MAARIVAASALATTASAGSIALSISDCGSGVPGHVTGISPSSITTGQTSTVTGQGTLDSDVAGGSFTLDVKALGVTLKSCNGDICSASSCDLPLNTGSLAFKGIGCPVKAGSVEIPIDVTVSSSIPSQLAVLAITMDVPGALCATINTRAGASFEETAQGACTADDQGKLLDAHTVGEKQDACGKKALGLSGINHDKFVSCVQSDLGISAACSECYYKTAQFGFANCKAACLLGWCKSGCLSCTQPAQDDLTGCAGFAPSKADPCDDTVV